MFQTTSLARHPIMSKIAGENEHVWSFVTLAVNAPWYFATYEDEIDGEILRLDIMLSTYQQVADLLSKQSSSFRVTDLLLATPGHVNKSDNWQLDPLEEVMIGVDSQTKFKFSVYRLANGTSYSDYIASSDSADQDNLQTVIKFLRPKH